jgi:P-type Mg2+ transporter
MSAIQDEKPWWIQPLSTCLTELNATSNGLTSGDANERLARLGPNVFRSHADYSLLLDILRRFKNPLVIILLVASAISGLAGDVASFVIIIVMVALSVTLDVIQESHAGKAAERLKESVAVRANVLRDGKQQDVLIAEVVPGDVVMLSAGDLVPADGRVVEAKDLFVKQGLLTGESYPVEKQAIELPNTATDMQGATNALFMGTSIVSGAARMVVIKTGTATAMGAIADTLTKAAPPTAFELGTRKFGLLIMRVTILMVLFVLLVNTVNHKPLLESFMFAIALAVGLTPELLPMIVTVTLSRGALRMADKHVIVKRLASIQNLGSMDVLCTDKTGTLTEAKIQLDCHLNTQGVDSARVLELAYLNSHFESGLKSPLDDAILAHSGERVDVSDWKKIDEVPFDFERRRVSVLIDNGKTRLLIVKGAPEDTLRISTHYEAASGGSTQLLNPVVADEIRNKFDSYSREGLRVLAIAWREVPLDHPHAVIGDETELTFAGFVGFLDPPKQSAGTAIAALKQSGITVKIVTGDSELVTQHICSQLNIEVTGVVTGAELAQMDDHVLRARVEIANLFCRVSPAQKDRVIMALKARGHVVGYMGDGINDAPSLHSADVGLSVASAVDVAKEAADIILLEENLQVVHDGVMEGRRTFSNIMKYIMMGTSSNFGNMFSMAGAALFLPFLPMLPTQILLNNILYDVSEIPIPLDKVDEVDTQHPRTWDMKFVRNFMLVVGPVSSLFDFLTFYVMIAVLKANESLFQTGWFIESLATQVLVIFVIRTRGNPLKSRPHRWLVATSLAIVAIAAMIPFTPLGAYFGFTNPPLKFFAILAAMVVSYLLLVELVKRGFYRWAVRAV